MNEKRKSLIECVRDFILTCPHLSDGRLNVDYTGTRPTEYSIDGQPLKSVLETYIGGDSLRQFGFVFGSVESYGAEAMENIRNNGFYEDFAAWLEEQTRAGNLPDLGDGRQAESIQADSTGYLFDNDEKTARYQIQCRLVYYQEGAMNI